MPVLKGPSKANHAMCIPDTEQLTETRDTGHILDTKTCRIMIVKGCTRQAMGHKALVTSGLVTILFNSPNSATGVVR
jgi:hypothetical protein